MALTRIRWDQKSIRELRTDPNVMRYIAAAAEGFARDVRATAPKDTGAGAASIAPHPSRAKGATDVGWDADHFYMMFPEFGTKYQAAQRFARDVLDRYTFD
jgi:HK97 gp10 family phage protein